MGFYISDHNRNLYCVHGGAPLYSETLEAAKKRREEHGLADSKIVELHAASQVRFGKFCGEPISVH